MNYNLLVEDASYQYNGKHLLTIEPFHLHDTGLGLVVGKNGAGKTLLLYLLSGRLALTQGRILLEQDQTKEDLSLKINYKALLRFMPDRFIGEVDMRVGEYLHQVALVYYGFSSEKSHPACQHVMALCLLEQLGQTEIKRLSLGEQRRLSIAVTLLGESRFIFLDEPFTGLDGMHAKKMRSILRKKANSTGIIVSGHDWQADIKMADYILWVRDGRVTHHSISAKVIEQVEEDLFSD